MKTPTSKKPATPKADENNKSKSESAKKLVQARLPFKVISTTISDETAKVHSSTPLQLKRKLSDKEYDGNSSNAQHEEVEKKKAEPTETNKKIKLLPEECVVVVLTDDENDEEIKVKPVPLIKLPFSNKKGKRRKSAVKNADLAVSSDEAAAELHPQKRVKVAEPEIDSKTDETKKTDEKEEEHDKQTNEEKDEEQDKQKNNEKQEEPKQINDEKKEEQDKQKTDEKEEEDKQKQKDEIEEEKIVDTQEGEVLTVQTDSSDCDTCSTTTEDKETTLNMVTSDAQKIDDNNASTSENKVKKPLTKKQMDLMERRRQAREEKEKKILMEKMQKQKEKEEREEAKKRDREEKEEKKRQEREEKEEKKRQEREEKERKRLAEIEAKNEERRKRTEAKEEERKRKDLEKEEAELKAKKRAQAFTKFFVPKTDANEQQKEQNEQITVSQKSEPEKTLAFRPFQVKGAMKLAPVCRRQLTEVERQTFDQFLQKEEDGKENLYLNELRTGKHLPTKCLKHVTNDPKETSSETGDDDDVQVVGK